VRLDFAQHESAGHHHHFFVGERDVTSRSDGSEGRRKTHCTDQGGDHEIRGILGDRLQPLVSDEHLDLQRAEAFA